MPLRALGISCRIHRETAWVGRRAGAVWYVQSGRGLGWGSGVLLFSCGYRVFATPQSRAVQIDGATCGYGHGPIDLYHTVTRFLRQSTRYPLLQQSKGRPVRMAHMWPHIYIYSDHLGNWHWLPPVKQKLKKVKVTWLVEGLFNATLTAEVISWRGRHDNVVAVGLDPKVKVTERPHKVTPCKVKVGKKSYLASYGHPVTHILFNSIHYFVSQPKDCRPIFWWLTHRHVHMNRAASHYLHKREAVYQHIDPTSTYFILRIAENCDVLLRFIWSQDPSQAAHNESRQAANHGCWRQHGVHTRCRTSWPRPKSHWTFPTVRADTRLVFVIQPGGLR